MTRTKVEQNLAKWYNLQMIHYYVVMTMTSKMLYSYCKSTVRICLSTSSLKLNTKNTKCLSKTQHKEHKVSL